MTVDEIRAHMTQWKRARSLFMDNIDDNATFEPLDMQMERNAGEWLLTLLAENEALKQSLLEIANKGAYEMDHIVGGEHGHGVSTGLVKAGKYAAMTLRNMGLIDVHPVLDANVTVNPIGRDR